MLGMPSEKVIKAKVKCCACGGSLEGSHINMVCLMKEAKWGYPCWGNILLGLWPPCFASAIVCDNCLHEKKKIKFALEWSQDLSVVKYHPLEDLKDVPKEIFDPLDELELGRHRIGG